MEQLGQLSCVDLAVLLAVMNCIVLLAKPMHLHNDDVIICCINNLIMAKYMCNDDFILYSF